MYEVLSKLCSFQKKLSEMQAKLEKGEPTTAMVNSMNNRWNDYFSDSISCNGGSEKSHWCEDCSFRHALRGYGEPTECPLA